VRSPRVLIVEDEARLASLLSKHLTDLGLHPRVEANRSTGLETALAEAFGLITIRTARLAPIRARPMPI
jgi:DNA-binding response OmpR family regulator